MLGHRVLGHRGLSVAALGVVVAAALGVVAMAWAHAGHALFTGRNLDGWVPVMATEGADPNRTWQVQYSEIVCKGTPQGYLRTQKQYRDYVLKLQWSFARPEGLTRDSDFKGKGAIMLHVAPPDKLWPKCVEIPLVNSTTATILPVAGAKTDSQTTSLKWTPSPLGRWNLCRIVSKGGTIEVTLNGQKAAKITGVEPSKGYIALKSEGAEIRFQNIILDD